MMRRPLNLKAALAAATLCLLAPAWSGQTRGTPERIEPARTAAAQANPVPPALPPTLPPPQTAGALKSAVRRSAEGRELTLPFSQIGQVHHPHEVRRGQFRQRLHFELRTDELVRRATLTLMLAPSPDLLGRNDLLVVKLNSETVGRIAVPPASGLDRSGQFSTRLELDPKLLTDSNELTVQFAAPPQCDSAQFPRVSVNGHSSLQLTVQPLPLANDLSVLPSPFFDRRDPGQTEVTLVTSDRPDGSTLQAAGQLASWFGALAGHRGARIRSRAVEQGLLSAEDARSDEAVAQAIFLSGFSTAEQVTEVSGRGVGMDAVRGFLQREGGDVHIHFRDANTGADYRSFELVVSLPARFGTQLDQPGAAAAPDLEASALAV